MIKLENVCQCVVLTGTGRYDLSMVLFLRNLRLVSDRIRLVATERRNREATSQSDDQTHSHEIQSRIVSLILLLKMTIAYLLLEAAMTWNAIRSGYVRHRS